MSREYIVLSFLVALSVMISAWILRKSIARIPLWQLLLTSLSFFALRAAIVLFMHISGIEGLLLAGDFILVISIALICAWAWNVFFRRTH